MFLFIIFQVKDEATKNHQSPDNETTMGGIMPELKGSLLDPVVCFITYSQKLHPKCQKFFQRPLPAPKLEYWYANKGLGKNTLNDMLKLICKDANINQEYTNHSLRATGITMLHDSNFPTEQI